MILANYCKDPDYVGMELALEFARVRIENGMEKIGMKAPKVESFDDLYSLSPID